MHEESRTGNHEGVSDRFGMSRDAVDAVISCQDAAQPLEDTLEPPRKHRCLWVKIRITSPTWLLSIKLRVTVRVRVQ